MFSMDELLSKRNKREAMKHLLQKPGSVGADGMSVAEFEEYWKLNETRIEAELRDGSYQPSVVKNYETVNGKGKRRVISNLSVTDRFLTRLLAQKMKRYIEPMFLEYSYAYQDGKGIVDAVMLAQKYMQMGLRVLVEIDLKDYFDTVSIEALLCLLRPRFQDEMVYELIKKYLYCKISYEGQIVEKQVGLVQGNSISPILSNLFLYSLDEYLSANEWKWMRFADNIYLFTEGQDEGSEIFNKVCKYIREELRLRINEKKSGVYDALERRILGYEFYAKKDCVEVRKYVYKKFDSYGNWHKSALQQINNEYHLVQDGVLNKKDYALLFENEDEKHHIPVEVVDQMNLYSNITIAANVWTTLSAKKIRLAIVDKYGNIQGYYMPWGYQGSAFAVLGQCEVYLDKQRRLELAKQFEIAGIHNMRANLRYYYKKEQNVALKKVIEALNICLKDVKEVSEIEHLLLIEARARQQYYLAFVEIIENPDFAFAKRTRRPPEDAINAMISFGNTLLYNLFLKMIGKTQLDPRIAVVHAANRRNHSLNLDFADIFKPIIVDRVIFSMINLHQIKADDFEKENGGIYLSKTGKRIFIEEFEEKLQDSLNIDGSRITYRQLMEREVMRFQRYILNGEKYRPYKYY